MITHTHTHTQLTALCPGLPGWAGTREVKPIWILLKQEMVRQWHHRSHMQVCTSLQTDNHARTPPLSFYRPDALPATQPTASKQWRQNNLMISRNIFCKSGPCCVEVWASPSRWWSASGCSRHWSTLPSRSSVRPPTPLSLQSASASPDRRPPSRSSLQISTLSRWVLGTELSCS